MNYSEIFQILGDASIAFIIYLIVKEIINLIRTRNGSYSNYEKIQELEHLVNNDYRHELDNIWAEIRGMRSDFYSFKEKVEEKINTLENKIIKIETYGERK